MKPLPFRAWRKKYTPIIIEKDDKGKIKSVSGNYYISSNWESIIKILKIIDKKMPYIKAVVLDDKKIKDLKTYLQDKLYFDIS